MKHEHENREACFYENTAEPLDDSEETSNYMELLSS